MHTHTLIPLLLVDVLEGLPHSRTKVVQDKSLRRGLWFESRHNNEENEEELEWPCVEDESSCKSKTVGPEVATEHLGTLRVLPESEVPRILLVLGL